MRIDSHHHFWKYNPQEYCWISDEMSSLRRDFLPDDLNATIHHAKIDHVISVQARQNEAETPWLLDLAGKNDFISGVVGWVPLVDPLVEKELEELSSHPKLRAIRHVVQGEPDDHYILREDFNRGIRLLRKFDLAYDILIFEKHLSATTEFVDRHPDQRFIVDHIAKPRIKDGLLEPWKTKLLELAKRPNVWCKLSGVVTEADFRQWTEEGIRPYLETALEAFGSKRLMFGSDWPVCLVATRYEQWVGIVERLTSKLSASEQDAFWRGNAVEAYQLSI